jgi:hypothetical protein
MAINRRVTPELLAAWLGKESQTLKPEKLTDFAQRLEVAIELYIRDEPFGFDAAGVAARNLEAALRSARRKPTSLKCSKAAELFKGYPSGAKRFLKARANARSINFPMPEDIADPKTSQDACDRLLTLLVYGYNYKDETSLRYAPRDGMLKDAQRAFIGALGATWDHFLSEKHGQAARYAQRETPTNFMVFCSNVFEWIWQLNKLESTTQKIASPKAKAKKHNIQNLVHSAIERGFLIKNST